MHQREKGQVLSVLSLRNLGASLAICLYWTFGGPAFACLERPVDPPEMIVIGDPCDPFDNTLLVILKEYTSFAADPSRFCKCALNMPLFLGQVTGATVVLSDTLTPLPGFSFGVDPLGPKPFQDVTPLNGSQLWNVFGSSVTANINPDIEVDLVFSVNPALGELRCDNYLDELQRHFSNADFAVGVGEADADGELISHIATLPIGNVTLREEECPTCIEPPKGMIAWWALDETSSDISIDAATFYDGVHMNGPTPVKGMVQGALEFDGINDYVEAADVITLNVFQNDFSIDVWIKTTDSSGVKVLLDKRASAGRAIGYHLFLNNGAPGFQLADGSGPSNICSGDPSASSCTNYGSGFPIADGAWHLVAVTVDRDQPDGGRFYVDGVQVATFNPTVRAGSLSNKSSLRLGSRNDGSGFFRGVMDEFEIHNRVLDEAEIKAIFQAGSAGKCKPDPQKRMIAHVTPNTTFFSEIIVTNPTNQQQAWHFRPFDLAGNPLPQRDSVVSAGETQILTTASIFGSDPVSHFEISNNSEVRVAVSYRFATQNNSAQAGESRTTASTWRITPGDWTVVFDGLALVNMGNGPINITIDQKDLNGAPLNTASLPGPLASRGKMILLLSNFFNELPNSYFEVKANGPINLIALRFNRPSFDILWQNLAFPIP